MIFGNCHGKMGDVVFQRSAQREFQRVYLSRHRKNYSLKNLAVRARMAVCAKAWNHFKQLGLTDYTQREFCKVNFSNVYYVTREQYENDPAGISLFKWNLYKPVVSPFSYFDENYIAFVPYYDSWVDSGNYGIELSIRLKLGEFLTFAHKELGGRSDWYYLSLSEFYNVLLTQYIKYDTLKWCFVNVDRDNVARYACNSMPLTEFDRSSSPFYYLFWGRYGDLFQTWAGNDLDALLALDVFPPHTLTSEPTAVFVQRLLNYSGTGVDVQDPYSVSIILGFQFYIPNFPIDSFTQNNTNAFYIKGLSPMFTADWNTELNNAVEYSKAHEEEILLTWAKTPEERNVSVYSEDDSI